MQVSENEKQIEAVDRMAETQSLVAEYWLHREPKYRNRRPVDVALASAALSLPTQESK